MVIVPCFGAWHGHKGAEARRKGREKKGGAAEEGRGQSHRPYGSDYWPVPGAGAAPLVAGALAPLPSVVGEFGPAFGLVPLETVPVVGPPPAPLSPLLGFVGATGAAGALEAGGVTMTTGGAAAGGGVATTIGAGAGVGADWTGAGAGADVFGVGELSTAAGASAGGGAVTVVRAGTTVADVVGLGRLR